LIEQKIIKIPENLSKSPVSSYKIPSWIKNNANWWSQGITSDKEFFVGIQFMIDQGIIKI